MDFEYRFSVSMSSVDAAGMMFFPELLRHAHDAYEAFMRSLGHGPGAVLARGRYLLPIRRAEADYRQPMRLGAECVVYVGISRIGNTSFTVLSRFVDADGHLCACAKTVHVCVDAATGQPMPLPEAVGTALQPYQVERDD